MGTPTENKTGIVIQARMGAERLPGKILKLLAEDQPVLKWVVERCRKATRAQQVIVATTVQPADDIVEKFCRDEQISCFRGSETDVFSRYVECARKFQLDASVRVTADCPFLSPEVIDLCIQRFWDSGCDYVNNSRLAMTYPRGLDVEVVSAAALERLTKKNLTASEKEHVTLYIYRHPDEFRIETVLAAPDFFAPDLRMTLDTQDDFELLDALARRFPAESWRVDSREVVKYLRAEPALAALNQHIEQKRVDGKII